MINSTRFGQVDVDSAVTFTFPHGIPGFEASTQWKMFYEIGDDGKPKSGFVFYLQSLSDPDACLPIADPGVFGFGCEFVLSDAELAELELEDTKDLAVLVVLSNKGPESEPVSLQNVFANIAAPILINVKSQIGMQKIFAGPEAKISQVVA
ncbi:MAG: flagellar assembly protein FliW [Sulfuricella sp.]|nr:flagellar assembly protein FliW [Sulfuricella sp.]